MQKIHLEHFYATSEKVFFTEEMGHGATEAQFQLKLYKILK
jgi:hypothetical protein